MKGRDYARYFNMLLECRKEMEYGYSYGFNDLKFSELDDHILKELKRVADILKIESKKDIENLLNRIL